MALDMDDCAAILAAMEKKEKSAAAKKVDEVSGVTMFSPAVGDNYIRILPALSEKEKFFIAFKSHFEVGPNKEYVVCPSTIGQPCPICEFASKIWKEADKIENAEAKEAHQTLAKQNFPGERYKINVVELKDPTDVKIYECPKGVFQQILGLIVKKNSRGDTMYKDITDLKEGRFINVNRIGTGKQDTKYTTSADDQAESISADYMTKAPHLGKTLKVYPYEFIKNVMLGKERIRPATGGTLSASDVQVVTEGDPSMAQAVAEVVEPVSVGTGGDLPDTVTSPTLTPSSQQATMDTLAKLRGGLKK